MMLAAPPRAKTGAQEPNTAVASAAMVSEHFRHFFMSNILVWRRPMIGCAEIPCVEVMPLRRAACSASPQSHLRGGTATVTQIKRGKSVMARLIALE
jgi:hypothetical protein